MFEGARDAVPDLSRSADDSSKPVRFCLPFDKIYIKVYGEHFQQSMDPLGMVTNSARGQLNMGEYVFPPAL